MRKILMILSATFVMASCGAETKSECAEDCKKECCSNKEESKCEKDCKKPCCSKKEEEKKEDMPQLEIGTVNPSLEVSMKNITGEELTLASIAKENGLLVIFSCNTCPFVVGRADGSSEGWEGRYNEVKDWANEYKVGFVLVNSNEAKREGDDSFEEMIKHAEDKEYNSINYVVDKNHVVADAFGARTTPHVYLFNKENKLVYRGAIDDNVDSKEEVKEQYLANALKNLAEGTEINPAVTKNLGCSIKRVIK